MEFFGIKFAPLCVPLHRRLETVAVALAFSLITFCPILILLLFTHLLLCTTYWWLPLLYLVWLFYDKDVCENGGRSSKWVRNLVWFKYCRDFFPLTLIRTSALKLDRQKNYMFCAFPHGVLWFSGCFGFLTNSCNVDELYPDHVLKCVGLKSVSLIPFVRELLIGLGFIVNTGKAIEFVLNGNGGNIVCLAPGGASEAFCSQPGQYKILLKRRKGFVRLALKTGTSLVPVVTFGETDTYNQYKGPKVLKIQEVIRKITGVAPIITIGRGIFQYSFGMLPQRKPLHLVVGPVIDVVKNESPSVEQIDELHSVFTKALIKLFDEEKHKYIKNSDKIHLDIVDDVE